MKQKILILGSTGFVGNALGNKLIKQNNYMIFGCDLKNRIHYFPDALDYYKPDIVINCAAKVGGIQANINDPYGYLFENLEIQNVVINECVKRKFKLVQLGSSCIYPKDWKQPLKEEYLLEGPLEPTNEGYSLAKIAGLKLAEYANKQYETNIISLMPCNLVGPGSSFDPKNSHVFNALIKKIVDAKYNNIDQVEVWGDGYQRREFLDIYDMVDCIIWSLENLDQTDTFLNVGNNYDVSIMELAFDICSWVSYDNKKLFFNCNKPMGMTRKKLDTTKINDLGWYPKTTWEKSLRSTIKYYKENFYGN